MLKYPEMLYLLFGLIPLLGAIFLNYYRTSKILKIINRSVNGRRVVDLFFVKRFLLSLLLLLSYIFIVLSLAGFTWKKEVVNEESDGLDIVFAIDISNSMSAKDIAPGRLQRVSEVMKSLILNRPGVRYGVVVFKGEAMRVVPLTSDKESIYYLSDSLYSELLSAGGTDVGNGVLEAIDSFVDNSLSSKIVFLFSDGGEVRPELSLIEQASEKKDVVIHSVASATSEGGEIFYPNGRIINDENGSPVISRLNSSVMKSIAEAGGGEYFNLDDSLIVSKLLKSLTREYSKVGQNNIKIDYPDQFRLFALASFVLICGWIFLKVFKWKKLV
jgi:Ca-activated chloride channel family protein